MLVDKESFDNFLISLHNFLHNTYRYIMLIISIRSGCKITNNYNQRKRRKNLLNIEKDFSIMESFYLFTKHWLTPLFIALSFECFKMI